MKYCPYCEAKVVNPKYCADCGALLQSEDHLEVNLEDHGHPVMNHSGESTDVHDQSQPKPLRRSDASHNDVDSSEGVTAEHSEIDIYSIRAEHGEPSGDTWDNLEPDIAPDIEPDIEPNMGSDIGPDIEISTYWQRRFYTLQKVADVDDNGVLNHRGDHKLTLKELLETYFHIWTLILGPISYLVQGMWRKGFIILSLLLSSRFVIAELTRPYDIPNAALIANIVINLLCATMIVKDYYIYKKRGVSRWPQIPRFLQSIFMIFIFFVLNLFQNAVHELRNHDPSLTMIEAANDVIDFMDTDKWRLYGYLSGELSKIAEKESHLFSSYGMLVKSGVSDSFAIQYLNQNTIPQCMEILRFLRDDILVSAEDIRALNDLYVQAYVNQCNAYKLIRDYLVSGDETKRLRAEASFEEAETLQARFADRVKLLESKGSTQVRE